MLHLRLLACFAHPDDEAFTAAGVLAVSVACGVDVRLICATRGEEGDIRFPGAATRKTLGQVRDQELRRSCQMLGVQEPMVLGYRDSGWGDSPAQYHPQALVNAPAQEVVERLVAEMRRFRPHVVLTFEPGGLSGHRDHITISRHTTIACQMAGDAGMFPVQLQHGLVPHSPQRLFYTARPLGFRLERARLLRRAGIEVSLPDPELPDRGIPPEHIHVTLDVSSHVEKKVASMLCHRTQIAPDDWPYRRLPQDVAVALLGTEYLLCGYPPTPAGVTLSADLFAGVDPGN
ncbi:MAG TPA: PIG-L deacetylase family protein [Candidatus Tectomicrobia bacterium]|jgi:LmbE family N-acetylglucosaminyl deacetylase